MASHYEQGYQACRRKILDALDVGDVPDDRYGWRARDLHEMVHADPPSENRYLTDKQLMRLEKLASVRPAPRDSEDARRMKAVEVLATVIPDVPSDAVVALNQLREMSSDELDALLTAEHPA